MEPKKVIKILIGLGNPGEEYENTFHNAGHLFVSWFLNEEQKELKKRKLFDFFESENHLILARTNIFMNESGLAVKQALKEFGYKAENLIVAHDDSDIMLGEFKMSFDRGAAGHKGVISIMENVKTQKFWRLRIGIRTRPKERAEKIVLKKIGKEDAKKLYLAFAGAKLKVIEKLNP